MPQRRIAIYGGSFNPPGIHHVEVVRRLTETFDKVIVVPCGPRPDKAVTNDIAPSHRATMADLAFGGIDGIEVDLFDLDNDVFTANVDLQARYADRGRVHHVVGSDLIGPEGACPVRQEWKDGERLWVLSRFAVVMRPGYPGAEEGLPPHHETVFVEGGGSSTEIRRRIFDRQPFEHLVPQRVADYIRRYGLYRMSMPSETSHLSIEEPSVAWCRDIRNDRAIALSESLPFEASDTPDIVMVFGGDGTMLRAVKSDWRMRAPFYGVNLGHVGFLLNEWDGHPFGPETFRDLTVHRISMLDVELEMANGSVRRMLAFNDAYVQNVDQAAWVRISVDDIVRAERMVADTVLVSSPAGSTAYARAMGAAPMLLGHPGLVIAASAVNEPFGWRPVHLPESTVTIEALHPGKRPVIGKVDGEAVGPVARMTVRTSRTASAELAFRSDVDLEEKRIAIQFPKKREP